MQQWLFHQVNNNKKNKPKLMTLYLLVYNEGSLKITTETYFSLFFFSLQTWSIGLGAM